MSTFSQPTDCLTTSVTIDDLTTGDMLTSIGNITLDTNSFNYTYTTASNTISTIAVSPVTIASVGAGINWGTTNIYNYREFVDTLPALSKIQDMCEQYPGLKIAFEKFKTTYYLVKDDYDLEQNKK